MEEFDSPYHPKGLKFGDGVLLFRSRIPGAGCKTYTSSNTQFNWVLLEV